MDGHGAELELKQLGIVIRDVDPWRMGRLHPPGVLTETARQQGYRFLSNDLFEVGTGRGAAVGCRHLLGFDETLITYAIRSLVVPKTALAPPPEWER